MSNFLDEWLVRQKGIKQDKAGWLVDLKRTPHFSVNNLGNYSHFRARWLFNRKIWVRFILIGWVILWVINSTKNFIQKNLQSENIVTVPIKTRLIGVGILSYWDVLFWVGTVWWDKIGHGMVRGPQWAWKNGTSFMDVP
jgi:hypothetical protein